MIDIQKIYLKNTPQSIPKDQVIDHNANQQRVP